VAGRRCQRARPGKGCAPWWPIGDRGRREALIFPNEERQLDGSAHPARKGREGIAGGSGHGNRHRAQEGDRQEYGGGGRGVDAMVPEPHLRNRARATSGGRVQSIIPYTDGAVPTNEYPARIVFPPRAAARCTALMVSGGAERDGHCGVLGYADRDGVGGIHHSGQLHVRRRARLAAGSETGDGRAARRRGLARGRALR
jgi:hypothetical protein